MLSLDTGKSDIFLWKCITTQYGQKLYVENISVLWKYKNVLTNVNNLIKFITVPDHPATGVAFEQGYWTFNMIADHLAESNITLERHMHDNRCSILSPQKKLNLSFWSFARLSGKRYHSKKYQNEITFCR